MSGVCRVFQARSPVVAALAFEAVFERTSHEPVTLQTRNPPRNRLVARPERRILIPPSRPAGRGSPPPGRCDSVARSCRLPAIRLVRGCGRSARTTNSGESTQANLGPVASTSILPVQAWCAAWMGRGTSWTHVARSSRALRAPGTRAWTTCARSASAGSGGGAHD